MSAFDLKLAEMLASRLCHDLINPVGAIAIGVELLSELDDTTRKDALDLVASSADRATKRISFFRVAYGFAGHDEGQSVQQVRGFAEGFLAGGKVALDWPARPEDAATALPRSGLKVLSGLIALAAESLPRGGTLAVAVDAPAGGRVVATGTGARGSRLWPKPSCRRLPPARPRIRPASSRGASAPPMSVASPRRSAPRWSRRRPPTASASR